MAPVPLELSPSYVPTAVVGAHLFSIAYLSLVASRTIYRSYLALPPSSATRHREPLRREHVRTFSVLAIISLLTAGLFGVKFALLSYRVWATERGVDLPESLFGDKGALRAGEHPGRFHLVRWLNDTPFYRDAREIVAENARHFWWSQQVNLGLIPFSTYLALEGQRRKISNLWAFLALAQLVSLSYAQNLFFVAVLLTPVPLPENVRDLTRNSVPVTSSRYYHLLEKLFPRKPDGFLPRPTLYNSLLLASFATTFLLPFATNTTAFVNVSWISGILPFTFLFLPYVIPAEWGIVSDHPHESHEACTTLFRVISFLSAALHLKSTAIALFHNMPESTYYRHSLLHPFKEESRTHLGRGSTAIGRVFGAVGEHPAVGSVAWDVILTGLSLGMWAAVRGLDASEMLRSIIIFMSRSRKSHSAGLNNINYGPMTTRAKNAISGIDVSVDQSRKSLDRPKKSERNRSAGLLDRDRLPATRSVRKDTSNSVGAQPASSSRQRHSTVVTGRRNSAKSRETDEYCPSDDERIGEGDEESEADFEVAAFAWGLLAVGGLGTGAAAVYGAETTSR